MINNGGAITSVCKIDGRLYAQVFKKHFILVAVIIGLSVAGIGLEILFCATRSNAYSVFLLVSFCALFVLGALLSVIILWTVKKSGASQKKCVCEIFGDCMMVSVYEKDAKISEAAVYYASLYKSVETKDYFLAYTSKTAFCPVLKADLTFEERNAVRKFLRLRILQGFGVADVAVRNENTRFKTADTNGNPKGE